LIYGKENEKMPIQEEIKKNEVTEEIKLPEINKEEIKKEEMKNETKPKEVSKIVYPELVSLEEIIPPKPINPEISSPNKNAEIFPSNQNIEISHSNNNLILPPPLIPANTSQPTEISSSKILEMLKKDPIESKIVNPNISNEVFLFHNIIRIKKIFKVHITSTQFISTSWTGFGSYTLYKIESQVFFFLFHCEKG